MKHLSSLPARHITFAIHRYGFVYIVQENLVTILDPNHSVTTEKLDFNPSTWSSFGGSFILYHPTQGLAQFTGSDLTLLRDTRADYSAPFAQPAVDGKLLLEGHDVPFNSVNGLYYQNYGSVWRYPDEGMTFMSKPTGALVEPGNTLIFNGDLEHFASYNGITGNLMYAEAPPELVVPYVFPQNGVVAGGVKDGYVFSPDQGMSWRHRKLSGFGVFTEQALLQVEPFSGVQLVKGWW